MIFRSAPEVPRSVLLSAFPGSVERSAAEPLLILRPPIIQLLVLSIISSTFALLSFIDLITSAGTLVSPFVLIVAEPPAGSFAMSDEMSDQLFCLPFIDGLLSDVLELPPEGLELPPPEEPPEEMPDFFGIVSSSAAPHMEQVFVLTPVEV